MAQENNNDDANPINENGIPNRPACAACKHQRKRCIQGRCILWTLFPAAETKEFEAVHKLFGISNVTKLILELDSEDKRVEAAKTMKYEAMGRMMDPVSGATGEIYRLRQIVEMLQEKVRGVSGENLRLRQKFEMVEEEKEMLKLENRQLRHRLQESHVPRPVHHHCSCVWVGNTQQSYGNYSQVFQINGDVANNEHMGFENGVIERVRTETSIHLQGRYNGNNTINSPSSAHAKVVYDSGRVVRMEAEERGGMQLARSPGAEKSIHRQGEYNGDESIDNCKSANVSTRYDFLGVEAGSDIRNIVNGRSCDVVNVGTGSRIGQSIHHGGYNGNNTTNDSSNTNERGHNYGRMVVESSEEYIVNGDDGTSRTQLPFHQQSGYDFGRIVGMEAAGRNGNNIVNGESSQEGVGVAQTGSGRRLEQSFQQESVDGDVASFPPEY